MRENLKTEQHRHLEKKQNDAFKRGSRDGNGWKENMVEAERKDRYS